MAQLSEVVVGPGGVTSQWVLKTVATRTGGIPVFGSIGLLSTAPNDDTGGHSQIVLTASSLVFVPDNDPNASPSNLFTLALVNGVLTLTVPAANIGDLSLGTSKLAANSTTARTFLQRTATALVSTDNMTYTEIVVFSGTLTGLPVGSDVSLQPVMRADVSNGNGQYYSQVTRTVGGVSTVIYTSSGSSSAGVHSWPGDGGLLFDGGVSGDVTYTFSQFIRSTAGASLNYSVSASRCLMLGYKK